MQDYEKLMKLLSSTLNQNNATVSQNWQRGENSVVINQVGRITKQNQGGYYMREIDIQNAIRIALSKYGVVIRQNTGNFALKDGRRITCGVKGLSDLLFIGKNYVAFIEVKNATGKATDEQVNFIKKMQSLGHKAGICRSVEDALKLIGETE
jgi:hypothetical protein